MESWLGGFKQRQSPLLFKDKYYDIYFASYTHTIVSLAFPQLRWSYVIFQSNRMQLRTSILQEATVIGLKKTAVLSETHSLWHGWSDIDGPTESSVA